MAEAKTQKIFHIFCLAICVLLYIYYVVDMPKTLVWWRTFLFQIYLTVTTARMTYLAAFPIVTNIRKPGKGTFKTPAAKVKGSPTIGSQEKSKLTRPYLLKVFCAFDNCCGLKGNHFLFWNLTMYLPNHQFKQAPATLPAVAKNRRRSKLYFLLAISAVSNTSDWAGNSEAARKAAANIVK